jgi:DNA-binding MarR family transcriptional regulator
MEESTPGPPPADIGDRLAEVFDLVGPLYRRAQRRVELDLPGDGMSVGVRAVLKMLCEHGPMTVPQMSRAQALSRQFVQRMVNDAAAGGLVESVVNPMHRRSSLIRLTGTGHAAITRVTDRERTVLRHAGGDVSPDDLDGCVRVLTQLLRVLDTVEID